MADTVANFFNVTLAEKIGPELVESVGAIFRFDIEGAGTWVVDLKNEGTVTQGEGDADCVIGSDADSWAQLVENPSSAIALFMDGKITASDFGLATKLQEILA